MKSANVDARGLLLAAALGLSLGACAQGREVERHPPGVDAGDGVGGGPSDASGRTDSDGNRGTGGNGAGTGGNGAGAGGNSAGAGGRGGPGSGGTTGAGGAGTGGRGVGGVGVGGTTAPPSPASLSGTLTHPYGDLEVRITSAAFDWIVRNDGDLPSPPLGSVNDNATELIVVTAGCSGPIPGHGSCTMSLAFMPSDIGTRSASFTVDGGSAGQVKFTATATGGARITVMKAGNGTGTVISDVGGLNCGTTCTFLLTSGSVLLTARTTNGSNTIFSGFSGACAGVGRLCRIGPRGSLSMTATFTTVTANLVFGTQMFFPPNRGSAVAYDADCNAAATAAGINDAVGTAYTSMTSDINSLARNRLGATARGWVRMDGQPFADTQTALFDNQAIFNPVVFDENGSESSGNFMTGTNANGRLPTPTDTITNCNNWTLQSDPYGFIGADARMGAGSWLSNGSFGCPGTYPLLCMGHTKNIAVAPAATAGKKIWLANAALQPGAGTTPDGACQASRPAGVTTAAALIAFTNRSAASLLDMTANYVRPDGTFVGTGTQIAETPSVSFRRNALTSGIWQYGNGSYLLSGALAWTGQSSITELGTTASTCGDWTDSTQIGSNGVPGTTYSHWFVWDNTAPCAAAYLLYCVQTVP